MATGAIVCPEQFAFGSVPGASGAGPDEPDVTLFDAPGADTFTAPTGGATLLIEAWGGGGGGAGASFNLGGSGGGGGAYARVVYEAGSEEVISLTVGAGGAGGAGGGTSGTGAVGVGGGDTTVGGGLLVAAGATVMPSIDAPGVGGQVADCTGDALGAGGDGSWVTAGSGSNGFGGGGAGGGFLDCPDQETDIVPGHAGVGGGGAGGAGSGGAAGAGAAGVAPGGGGGGGGFPAANGKAGGAGAAGRVRITVL